MAIIIAGPLSHEHSDTFAIAWYWPDPAFYAASDSQDSGTPRRSSRPPRDSADKMTVRDVPNSQVPQTRYYHVSLVFFATHMH